MARCIYGCGLEYTPTRAGSHTSKGHKGCFDSFRRAQSAAAAALHEPPETPKREQPECIYKCGAPFNPPRKGANTAKSHRGCYDAYRNRKALQSLIEPAGGYATPAPSLPKHEHPKGWEPHVEENGNTATAVSQPTENASPDEEELIRGWKLDPKQWRIVGPLNCRRWQAVVPVEEGATCACEPKEPKRHHEQKWTYYYKADLERIDPICETYIAALIDEVRSFAFIPGPRADGEHSFVAALADPQMGKGDQDGAEGTAQRILHAITSVEQRVADLRATGRKIGTLYFLGMGDLIEGCGEFYAQQTFRTTLNLRDQVNVMRRLVMKALERWAPLFDRVVVAAVGGNHGENRSNGKSFTDFADNHDLAIFDAVQDAARMSGAYDHVSFQIPKDELSLTLDMSGEIVGVTHGHLFKKGKAVDWWMRQAHGQQPIGDARILLSGHYHHIVVEAEGSKTHIQCPALEGGSDWYRFRSGQASSHGLLTMRVGANVNEFGWADLEIV